MRSFTARTILSALLVLTTCPGCSNHEEFPTQQVRGKVTCNGQPVTEATVLFMPKGGEIQVRTGKPARGVIGENGEYTLSTNVPGDGAIIGTHTVRVLALLPSLEEREEDDEERVPREDICGGQQLEVTVERGKEVYDLALGE